MIAPMKHLLLLATIVFAGLAYAQNLQEYSSETRFQLDLKVPDAALGSYLPKGWTPNVAAQGPAKDCNLRAVFIDRVTINGPDGKPVGKGSNRLVYLVAPVKDPSGASVQLVIGGLTEDPADAPGPFGVYLHATNPTVRILYEQMGLATNVTQDWAFAAATGEKLELHISFEPGVGNQSHAKRGQVLFGEESELLPDLEAGAGFGYPAKRHHESSRSREVILVQRYGRQLREVVRWDGEGSELG